MKATDLIREQHEELRALFDQLKKGPADQQSRLLLELTASLRAHLQMEQELLYPKFQEKQGFEQIVEQSIDEHSQARMSLGELERTGTSDRDFATRCKRLQQVVYDHMQMEERELLPRIERIWTNDMLEQLGLQLKRRFDTLVDEAMMGEGPEEETRI